MLGVKYADEIALALGKPSYAPSTEGLTLNSINTAIVLTICGILYGLSYEKLPGNKPFSKGLTLGLALYILSRIGDIIMDYPVSHGLVLDNALFSAPLFLLLYPFLLGRLSTQDTK